MSVLRSGMTEINVTNLQHDMSVWEEKLDANDRVISVKLGGALY